MSDTVGDTSEPKKPSMVDNESLVKLHNSELEAQIERSAKRSVAGCTPLNSFLKDHVLIQIEPAQVGTCDVCGDEDQTLIAVCNSENCAADGPHTRLCDYCVAFEEHVRGMDEDLPYDVCTECNFVNPIGMSYGAYECSECGDSKMYLH